MTIVVDVSHRLGEFSLEAKFESRGHLTALFGRSGSGKTSLVNIIAGLVRPDHGHVVVDGVTVVDTQKGIFVPKHRRRVGYVFQEGRLFPHLSVRQNLLYGQWFTPHAWRYGRFDQIIELLGIAPLLHRSPVSLSGGEKQRVAIGRALLASPRLLLMDEPLASLDEARKLEILPYIERLRDVTKIPIIYVSHSISEMARLATTVVIMSDGRVAAVGETSEVMGRMDLFPLTGRHEAGSVLEMTVAGEDAAYGLTILKSPAGEVHVPRLDLPLEAPLRVHIRARDVLIGLKRPEALSALNILEGRVAEVGPGTGPIIDVRLDLNGAFLLARVTRMTVDRLDLRPGRAVFAIIKSISLDRRSVGRARPAATSIGDDEITL